MRILFIYPNLYTQMGFNHGLASLSAVLKQVGHETRLVNMNENLPPVASKQDVYEDIREWGAGVVAFSCLTQQYAAALELAKYLRERAEADSFPLPPLIVGGIHPTMVPEDVMRDGVWDHVGVGECEDALLEMVRRVEAGETPDDVANFLSWKGGVRPVNGTDTDWVRNPVGAFPDFVELPEPDYELFDTQRITDNKHGWFGLMTSRGCPYRCTYCLNHKIIDRYKADLETNVKGIGFFRFRPADKMIAEIRNVLARYENIGTFILDDDLFTQNVEHAIEFCDAYEASGIGVPFVVNSHVKRLDPRVAEALSRAGCKILKLGIESGSPRVRKEILKRHMTQSDVLLTVESAEEYGLHTSGFVMIGLPGETANERLETVDLLAQARIGRFRTSFFFPFPGTDSYRMSLEAGLIQPDTDSSLTTFTDGSALDFGAEQNLLIDKLGVCMPWFVNARLAHFHDDAPTSARYAPIVESVLAMDEAAWRAFRPTVRDRDKELSAAAVAANELHYSIRYNSFMGVRSDYFLAEERGTEWFTAAAKPSDEDLANRALAAAAAEIA